MNLKGIHYDIIEIARWW